MSRTRRSFLALVVSVSVAGCAGSDVVHVTLRADQRPDVEARQVLVRAQVSGPIRGLHYKWFAVNGQADPQESDQPETMFSFADGVPRDRVRVELWRDDERVALDELDVEMDERPTPPDSTRHVELTITKVPPYDVGGPETRADIAGHVSAVGAASLRVVVYARAGEVWYVQPTPFARHPIAADGSWGTWTHTGTSYAALVVLPNFAPPPRYDVLPQVGGMIAARAIAEGVRR